jgi:hypothetical protein
MARHGWQGETGESTQSFACEQCGTRWRRPTQGGRAPRYCSDACKQHAYRSRKAADAARKARSGRASGASSGAQSGSAGGSARGGTHGQGSYSSWSDWSSGHGSSSGAGGRSTSAGNGRSEFHARSMSSGEARRTIFRIAGLADDGLTSVKKAYRSASRKLHPDHGATQEEAELFKLLSLAKSILEKAGLYV